MNNANLNDKTTRLKIGLFWNVFGSIGSKVLIMISSVLTARILGADKNGEFGMINNTVGMFSTFAALGLGTMATRFVVEFKENNTRRCGDVIALSFAVAFTSVFLFSMGLLFGSDWLAAHTLNNPSLSTGLRLSTVMLVFSTLNTTQNSILAGFEDFKTIAKIAIIQGVAAFPIYVITTLLWEVNGLVIGYGMLSIITFVIANHTIRKLCKKYHVNITFHTCLREYKLLFRFALPAMLMNIVVMPITWLGNTIIIQDPNGYYNVGVFNAANQWRSAITLLPAAIGSVILPFIITNEDETLEDVNILSSWFIVLVLSGGVAFISGLITIFYGKTYDFEALNASLIIICAVCGLLSFKEGIARNLIKYGHVWFGFFSNLLWGATFLLCILALKKWGPVGISLSYLVSYFLTTVIFIPFYIRKNIVSRKYFFNKNIIIIWAAYVAYLIISGFLRNIFAKGLLFLGFLAVVYWGCDKFFHLTPKLTAVITSVQKKREKKND